MRRVPLGRLFLPLVLVGSACTPTSDPEEGISASDGPDASESSTEADSNSSGATTGDGSATGSSEGSADSSGGATDPACDCVTGEEDFVELVCDVDEICDPVEVMCAEAQLTDCELADLTVVDPSVLPCHHDALVAGTPGMLRWELPYYPDPGASGQRRMIIVQEDRRALTFHESWGVPSYDISDVEVIELRAAEHFDGCMELGSAEEQLQCLFDAAQSSVDVCIEAHSFEIG